MVDFALEVRFILGVVVPSGSDSDVDSDDMSAVIGVVSTSSLLF